MASEVSKVANPWHERLRELYYREPFQPFVIRTADGKAVRVTRPMHIMFAPFLKTIHVATGPGEVTTVIDSGSVVEVTAIKRNTKTGKSGQKR